MQAKPRHILLALFVVACGYLLASTYGEVRQRTLDSATERQLVHARQAARGIEEFFGYHISVLEYLASLEAVRDLDDRGQDLLRAFNDNADDVTAVTRVDAAGRIVHTVPHDAGAIGADIAQQPHVRQIMADHRPVVSDVFRAVQGYATVALHVPVFRGEAYDGSLALLIPFDVLARNFLQDVRIGESGHAWLVSQGGVELYCANQGHIGHVSAEPEEQAFRALNGAMRRGESGAVVLPGTTHREGGTDAATYRAAFTPIHIGDTTWSIAVATREAEILLAAREFRSRWLLVAGLLVVGVLAYTYFTAKALAVVRRARERAHDEEVLRTSNETLLTVLESIDADVYVADLKTHEILFVNRRLRDRFGDELLGKTCWRAFQHGNEPCAHCSNPSLLDEAGRPAGPQVWERYNPVLGRWYLNHDRAIRWIDGRVVRLHLATDITEQRRQEEERRALEAKMQQAQKLESLGVLAGGIAHDFNNLLMGVLGHAELALRALPQDSAAHPNVQKIQVAATRAAELTNQMLAYSGRGRFLVEPVDLNRLIREMTHLLATVVSKKAHLVLDLAGPLPLVTADASQLRQVVMNLITNASEALGEESGSIRVVTQAIEATSSDLASGYLDEALVPGLYVAFAVTDTGCGMDPDTRARLFDPFYTTKFTGRGLGLAAVLGIVRGHRGAIRVESAPGAGTTLRILLPVTEQAATESREPAAPAGGTISLAGITVLVVDDDATVREVARDVLEDAGATVLEAVDGQAAVAVFRKHLADVDLVLLDMTMPNLAGPEAFEALQDLRPGVAVILCSGYEEEDATRSFSTLKPAAFLHKPYRVASLLRAIGAVLSDGKSNRNAHSAARPFIPD